jgi:hypothetical protein
MITNTKHLDSTSLRGGVQAKRVFIKDGNFSEEIPPIIDFSRQAYWPSYFNRSLRNETQVSRRAFDLWSQTQFGCIYSIDSVVLRPLVKDVVHKLAEAHVTWSQTKRCLRRTFRLAVNNLTQSVVNLKRFLKDEPSPFSPFNPFVFIKPKPIGFLKQVLQVDDLHQQMINRRQELLGFGAYRFDQPFKEYKIPPKVVQETKVSIPSEPIRGRSREFVDKALASLESRSRSRTPTFEVTLDLVDCIQNIPENKLSADYYGFWLNLFGDYLESAGFSRDSEEPIEFLGHTFAKGSVRFSLHPDFLSYAQSLPKPLGWNSSDEYIMCSLLGYGQRESTIKVDLAPFHQIRYFYLFDPVKFVTICKNLQPALKIPQWNGEEKELPHYLVKPKVVEKIKLVARSETDRALRLQQLIKAAGRNPVIPEEQRVALKEFTRFPSDLIVELKDFMDQGYSFEQYITFKREGLIS